MNGSLTPILPGRSVLLAAADAAGGAGGSFWVRFLYAAIIVAVVLALSAALSRGLDRLHAKRALPGFLLPPIRGVVKWGVLVLALLLILHNFGIRIGGVWALISTVLAMIAIGFVAVWSMLSNLLATALILIFRPFEIGDSIEFVGEATKGKVARLGLMFTTLEEEEGGTGVLQIPNNIIFQRVIRRKHGNGDEELVDSLRKETSSDTTGSDPGRGPSA